MKKRDSNHELNSSAAPAQPGLASALALALGFVAVPGALLFGAEAQAAGLSLGEALATAQKQSEEALMLREKDVRLQHQKTELWAGGLPNVQAYANAGRGSQVMNMKMFEAFGGGGSDTAQSGGNQGSAPEAFNIVQNMYSYGVQVAQPIFSFGRLSNAFKVASQTIDAQDHSRKRSMQQIQLQTLDAWYAVWTTRARLQVLEASLKRQRETVAFMENNFRMGSGLRAQVMLAVASLKSLEPERIRAEQAALSSAMALNRLLGRPVNDAVELDTAAHLEALHQALIRDEQSLEKAIAERPDMRALDLQRQALEGTAKGYRMLHRPALGFSGKLGIMAYELDQLGEFEQNRDWSVGLGLTWNLFDGLATTSKAKQFNSDARSVELAQRQASKFARIEIETAFQERNAADSAAVAAAQAASAAQEAVELLTQDFRAGKGAVTDLLQAEEGLRNAEFGVLAARYQLARSRASLRVALGLDLVAQEAQ
jgi:outer membrane protein